MWVGGEGGGGGGGEGGGRGSKCVSCTRIIIIHFLCRGEGWGIGEKGGKRDTFFVNSLTTTRMKSMKSYQK